MRPRRASCTSVREPLVRPLPLVRRRGVYRKYEVVRLKQCSSCAREIPDSATVCDSCRQWAVAVAAVPATPETPDTVPESSDSPATPAVAAASPASPEGKPGPAANRRNLTIVLCAAGGVGVFMLALLSAGGGSSSPAADAASNAATAAAPVTAPPLESSTTQKWNAGNSAYWVGNRRQGVAFELPAENTVQVWMRSVRPTLVVRCMARSTQVFVVTDSAMKIEPETEDHTVTFSIDDEPAVTERWPDSDDHDALFAPAGHAFAQRLMRARTFRFGFTPHNVDAVVAQFNVGGLIPLIEPAARECGWK